MRRVRLSEGPLIPIADGKLPAAFRVFRRGVNPTSKGDLLFDDVSARNVMAAFARSGVDLAIDLNHDSVDPAALAARADSSDARGWAKLELRDGELWAVGVTWTEDGQERLRKRKQRYISPYVSYDDDRRVMEVHNLALVSQPSTHGAQALVASRFRSGARGFSKMMDVGLVKKALEALESGDADAAKSVLSEVIASAASGDPDPKSDEDPAEASPEKSEEDSDAAASQTDGGAAALAAFLRRELGSRSNADVAAKVALLSAQVESLELERKANEQRERVELVGELVRLGREIPATAWANSDRSVPSDAYASMPLSSLRGRVAAFRASPLPTVHVSPPKAEQAQLSAAEQRLADVMNPEQKARFARARAAARGAR